MKLVVVGLDGAHWELIYPWIEEGALPNIGKIIRGGVWGDMLSCLPPVTLPNWKCYSTGKNPGKLGIFWWENIDFNKGRIYHPFHRKFLHKEIWDYISEAGGKVGVIGVPGTYPPKKVNGFMISGGPDAKEKGFTYPKELERRLRDEWGFKLRPQNSILDKEKFAEEVNEIIDIKFKVAKTLAKEYDVDFLQVTSFEINTMHHHFWNDPLTMKCWKTIDNHLKDFLNEKTNIFLMSDHGSNRIETVFNINAWLRKKGYLKLHSTSIQATKILYHLGIKQETLASIANKLKLRKILRKVIPRSFLKIFPNEVGEVKKIGSMIDWEESMVLASGQGPIYIRATNEDEKRTLINKIKKELEELVDPVTDKKIVERVYLKEEIYSGEYIDEAPDLIIDQAKGVHIPGDFEIEDGRIFYSPTKGWKAENKKWGLFAAYGPDIKSEKKIKISILDLAPTILHMFNISVPRDMDGRVLMEIFDEQSEIAKRKVRYREINEKEKIREKIRRLKIRDGTR
nr:alkaline phosphatase family protein [Candidatus Baldrarchaeota archaeon]